MGEIVFGPNAHLAPRKLGQSAQSYDFVYVSQFHNRKTLTENKTERKREKVKLRKRMTESTGTFATSVK